MSRCKACNKNMKTTFTRTIMLADGSHHQFEEDLCYTCRSWAMDAVDIEVIEIEDGMVFDYE